MKFYKCNICGNVTELHLFGGGTLVCCGEDMEELTPKVSEEGNEKHLPVVEQEDTKITVKVGSVEHPMIEAHYITLITILYNNKTQTAKLNHTNKPEATFTVDEEFNTMEVYEYCNIHGLWKSIYKKWRNISDYEMFFSFNFKLK